MAAGPHKFRPAGDGKPARGFWTREAEALSFNAAERRAQAPARFLISLLIGVGAATALNLPNLRIWLWLWLAANIGAQVIELVVLWRIGPKRPLAGRAAVLAGIASISLVSTAYAAGSLMLWRLPGMLGAASAVLVLGGCLVNVMMLSRGSALALAASGTPHAVMMVLGPFLVRPELARDPMLPAFTLSEVVFVFGVAVVWRHMDRLRRKEEQARDLAEERRAQAEAATDAKTRYAVAVSHELRTPLTAILAAADALARRAEHAQDQEAARMVGEAGRMMRRMLDDLLDLAKIEAGHMGLDEATFAPRALLEDVWRFWAVGTEGSDLQLTLDGVETLPLQVRGDPMRLRQVLNNLISNAVKFTESGAVRLSAGCTSDPEGGWRLTVAVVDTGSGISPMRLARLFTPFEQAHEAGARAGGTGLGLTISRELARLMGGDVNAESSPYGSRFTVWVRLGEAVAAAQTKAGPCAEAAEVERPLTAIDASSGAMERLRVLVVDDQVLVRRAIGILLEPLGLSADFAEGAAEALERLAAQPFDLVLMDVNLPDMDGRDATRLLRTRDGPNRDTSVIAVTGATHEAAVETYWASGMNGFVAKPLEPRDFYAALDTALRAADEDTEVGAVAVA